MKYFLSFLLFFGYCIATNAQVNKTTNTKSAPTVVDFTDPNTAVFGTDIRVIVNGVALLPSGDVDSDGDVDMNDYNDALQDDDATAIDWLQNNSELTDYSVNGGADLNLDGVINAIDLNYFLFPNLGKVSQIPD